MILTLTQTQAWQVRKLLPQCCNRRNGNCLLRDDGEVHSCPQREVLYAVICDYFAESVLPADQKLYEDIKKHNHYLEG